MKKKEFMICMNRNSNYFGRELERIMTVSGTKNYVIAEALKYDVSYISKWISGKSLPAKKNAEKVCSVIAASVMAEADSAAVAEMMKQYGVTEPGRLEYTICESLTGAYYVASGSESREKYLNNSTLMAGGAAGDVFLSDYAAGLDTSGPVDAVVMADLFSLDSVSKLRMAGIKNQRFSIEGIRKDIRLTYIVDISSLRGDRIYDVILFIHLLTHFSRTSSRIFYSQEAQGKVLLAVKGEYAGISVLAGNRVLCTTATSERNAVEKMYSLIEGEADPDRRLFFSPSMEELLISHEYLRAILSHDLKWLAGHITEQFLAPDVFLNMLERVWSDDEELKKEALTAYEVTRRAASKKGMRVMIYDTALTDFLLTGEIDFFNRRVVLSPEERREQLIYMKKMSCGVNDRIQVKMIKGGFSDDFKYITNPCFFLSESVELIRLNNGIHENNLLIVQDKQFEKIMHDFYEEIWNNRTDVVISDLEMIEEKMDNIIESADILAGC